MGYSLVQVSLGGLHLAAPRDNYTQEPVGMEGNFLTALLRVAATDLGVTVALLLSSLLY